MRMHHNMRRKGNGRRFVSVVILFAVILSVSVLTTGCGKKAVVDDDNSPILKDAVIESWNDGSVDTQYVDVTLSYDREVCWQEKHTNSLRVTISDGKISDKKMQFLKGESEKELLLRIQVDSVTNGTLNISRADSETVISAITSADGKYATQNFEINALIPSGVELTDVSEKEESGTGNPQVMKQVTHAWNIRSIAWIRLLENGDPVKVGENKNIEILDQAVAVHGHEFLQEDEYSAAETIAETLSKYYSDDYKFTSMDDIISVEKCNGDKNVELDLKVYNYVNVTCDNAQYAKEETHDDGVDRTGAKDKEDEINREMSSEEETFVNGLHISHMDETEAANVAYRILTVTGVPLGEEEIYSVYELEKLAALCYQNENMNKHDITMNETHDTGSSCDCPLKGHTLQGIDFKAFLELCGVDFTNPVYADLYSGAASGVQKRLTEVAQEICISNETEQNGQKIMLVMAVDGQPLTENNTPLAGPLAIIVMNGDEITYVDSLEKVLLGTTENPSDPEYEFHTREPYSESEDITFTVNIYNSNAPYLGAIKTKSFTTKQLENLMKEYPDYVYQNYYGLIGNQEEFESMGVGGWQDCFTGIDLYWLLTEQVGLDSFSGYAEFYGRDNDLYLTMDDISYFEWQDRAEQYNVINREGYMIPYAVPMLACVKNGYPIMPKHDHESEGSVSYNHLSDRLDELGVTSSIGAVKNDKGPFVACLGNLSGVFGGYQIETGGDCIRLDIYLDE